MQLLAIDGIGGSLSPSQLSALDNVKIWSGSGSLASGCLRLLAWTCRNPELVDSVDARVEPLRTTRSWSPFPIGTSYKLLFKQEWSSPACKLHDIAEDVLLLYIARVEWQGSKAAQSLGMLHV